MSRLLELQQQHASLIAQLVQKLNFIGYGVIFEEAKRTPEQAKIYFDKGIGSLNSLHIDKLANDLTLVKDGKVLTRSEDYAEAGKIWKSMDTLCWWGGDNKRKDGTPKPDGNHFSTMFMGRK